MPALRCRVKMPFDAVTPRCQFAVFIIRETRDVRCCCARLSYDGLVTAVGVTLLGYVADVGCERRAELRMVDYTRVAALPMSRY